MKALIGLLTVIGFFVVTHADAFTIAPPLPPPPRCRAPSFCGPVSTPTPAPTPAVLTGVFTWSITWTSANYLSQVQSGTQTITAATDADLVAQAITGPYSLWWQAYNQLSGVPGMFTTAPMSYTLVDVTTGEILATFNCPTVNAASCAYTIWGN